METAESGGKVIDLIAALESSVRAAKEARGEEPSAKSEEESANAPVAEVTSLMRPQEVGRNRSEEEGHGVNQEDGREEVDAEQGTRQEVRRAIDGEEAGRQVLSKHGDFGEFRALGVLGEEVDPEVGHQVGYEADGEEGPPPQARLGLTRLTEGVRNGAGASRNMVYAHGSWVTEVVVTIQFGPT